MSKLIAWELAIKNYHTNNNINTCCREIQEFILCSCVSNWHNNRPRYVCRAMRP